MTRLAFFQTKLSDVFALVSKAITSKQFLEVLQKDF
jgi:hypothetical protein